MLFDVRNYFLLLILAISAGLLPLAAWQPNQQANQAGPPQAQAPAPATPNGPVIVLNPAHGGTDTGARGANGVAEKDVVLQFARAVRAELARQGFRIVMTRDDDSNPSYDDRAAVANAYRDAIFISIHVSSTGTAGTARAYYYKFSSPLIPAAAPTTPAPVAPPSTPAPASPTVSFAPWAEAQKPYVDASHHLADILQGEIAQRFPGSPPMSSGVAIRGMQSVAAPAIAVEISSVSVPDPNSLLALGAPLAISVSHAILAFRPPGSAETK